MEVVYPPQGGGIIPMKKLKITILGSASGVPTGNRFPVSTVVESDDWYLFDAGEPCSSLLVRQKIPYREIKAVFISHMDPDHSGGIFMLIQLMDLTGRKKPLSVFLPEEAIPGLNSYLKTVHLYPDRLRFPLTLRPLRNGFSYRSRGTRITAFFNNHIKGRLKDVYPHLKLESYSFRLSAGGRKVVYSGDIGGPADLSPLLTGETDLLITEMAHFQPEELMSFLSDKKIGTILLNHIHPDLNDCEKKLLAIGRRYLGKKKVLVSRDGLKLAV